MRNSLHAKFRRFSRCYPDSQVSKYVRCRLCGYVNIQQLADFFSNTEIILPSQVGAVQSLHRDAIHHGALKSDEATNAGAEHWQILVPQEQEGFFAVPIRLGGNDRQEYSKGDLRGESAHLFSCLEDGMEAKAVGNGRDNYQMGGTGEFLEIVLPGIGFSIRDNKIVTVLGEFHLYLAFGYNLEWQSPRLGPECRGAGRIPVYQQSGANTAKVGAQVNGRHGFSNPALGAHQAD